MPVTQTKLYYQETHFVFREFTHRAFPPSNHPPTLPPNIEGMFVWVMQQALVPVQHCKSHHTIRTKLLGGTVERPLLSAGLQSWRNPSRVSLLPWCLCAFRPQHQEGDEHQRRSAVAGAWRRIQPRLCEVSLLHSSLLPQLFGAKCGNS